MANPIWKDFYVSLGTSDTEYRILDKDGNVIYHGKAVMRPGQVENNIRINDICADYLEHHVPDFISLYTFGGGATFSVEFLNSASEWEFVDSFSFYADWSYEHDFNPRSRGLSCPINGRVVLQTPIPYSSVEATDVEVQVIIGGSSMIGWNIDGDYTTGTALVMVRDQIVGVIIDVKDANVTYSTRYEIVDSCAEYALYYVNAYGGWDMLLIEGSSSESDSISRFTREVDYDNRAVSNRGKQEYVNEITKSMVLHTSWMTDDESSRMHHLLNSTDVYLFDIKTESLIPVLLTNSATDYKTFKGNGCKLVSYEIRLSLANDRVRR